MRLTPLGEELIILEDLGDLAPYALAERLETLKLPGVVEAAPAWSSIGLHLDLESFDLGPLEAALESLEPLDLTSTTGREIQIPVCWNLGQDLAQAAEVCGLTSDVLTNKLEEEPWPCRFIGFQPGFPYCGPLPSPLDQIPRLNSPRTKVPGGSVAVAAGQLGIYPTESPGGWMILGRTPLTICCASEGFFPIRPGDKISLSSITKDEFEARLGERL